MLTEAQLLLLNNFIYLDAFSDSNFFGDTQGDELTVWDILDKYGSGEGKLPWPNEIATTSKEWDELKALAESDETIKNLKITNMNKEVETGAKMACFVDENGQAYAVFAGTGADEWRDDFVAGTEVSSIQQEKALEWFNSLPYDNIVVSGHSKGGNKAMYVMICSDKAVECYAFDGEGFSTEFCDKYADKIARKRDKIHLRASYRDYVNILLLCIAGDVKYVYNDGGVNNFGEYHAPKALFKHDEKGNIVYDLGALKDYNDPLMEMLHEFTVYLLDNATEAEKILALSVLGELLTEYVGHGHTREDIIDMFSFDAIEIILKYLSKYLRELRIKDPKKYETYRLAFANIADDALGGTFWSYLLSYLLVLFPDGPQLFDKIADGTYTQIWGTADFFAGKDVSARDFSMNAKERMLGAAKEVEEEAWWRVDRWDCWYRIENKLGLLEWDRYTGNVDEYYRKLIDINEASAKDIEKIFEKVYQIDSTYASKLNGYIEHLETNVFKVCNSINQRIKPLS